MEVMATQSSTLCFARDEGGRRCRQGSVSVVMKMRVNSTSIPDVAPFTHMHIMTRRARTRNLGEKWGMGGGEVYQKNMASPMLGCTASRRKKKTAGRAILGEMRASV